jgi:FkbM family methyltransferase
MLKGIGKLKIIERNKLWLTSGLPLTQSLSYYPSLVVCYILMILIGRKRILYLGSNFYFDNKVAPLTLQRYPYEISRKIRQNITNDIESVLDIGGNIGQFSFTAKKMMNPKSIDIFEPNHNVFKLLEKNVKSLKGVNIFKYGIGKASDTLMHFEPGRSGLGSIIEENAGELSNLEQVDIEIIKNPAKLTKRSFYDLIKIDVEGYEYEVIKNISGITCRYIFIELSGQSRAKTHSHSDLLKIIENKFGKFNILHTTETYSNDVALEMLLEIVV